MLTMARSGFTLIEVLMASLINHFERDIPIWNSKRFMRRPLIVKEDGPILKFRRWTKQFYSDSALPNDSAGSSSLSDSQLNDW